MSHDTREGASHKPVGIKDIASALGVSIGTVDRALHGKPEVNPLTRARVLSMAKALGYRPNLAARYLKSRRQLRIVVHLPEEIALFWDSLRKGIGEAAAPLAPAVHVEFRSYPRLGEGDVPLFEEVLRDGADGLIIAPGKPEALQPHLREAARQGIPVVCVVTDAPGSERLTAVSSHAYTVGALAGELLARAHPSGGRAAFFTGWLSMQDHADKLRGFQASLATCGGALQLGPVVEAHDDEGEAYARATQVFRAHPDLTAVYVSTVNSLPVLRAAEQVGRLPGLVVVTTDLFGAIVERIRTGVIAATVYQRPLTQGRVAMLALYRHLLDGTEPPPRIHVVPHLVMRSNLDLLLARLPVDLEGARPTLTAVDSGNSGSDTPPAPAGAQAARVAGRRSRRAAEPRGPSRRK